MFFKYLLRLTLLSIFVHLTVSTHAQEPAVVDRQKRNDTERYRSTLLFANILELIRDEYVDASEVDYNKLTQAALEGMLSSLDPYSEFLDGDQFLIMRNETEGQFGGLGIYVGVNAKNQIIINATLESGPGAKAGLKAKDVILQIDNESTLGKSLSEAIHLLRGNAGQEVKLLVFRPESNEKLELTVIREFIKIPSVHHAKILDAVSSESPKIGYIFISQFGEKTEEEFDEAMGNLLKENIDGLILDLRNNPGGLLDSAVQIAGKFTPEGTIIAFTETRYGEKERKYFTAHGKTHHEKLPLVVLINRNSASGAEIVAGALKDLRRAVLIGERSFGKGSVQSVQAVDITIDPPVGIRLTTAKYYTPSALVIHKKGIDPDISINLTQQETNNVLLQQTAYRLPPEERANIPTENDKLTERAKVILQGLIINSHRTISHAPSPQS